MANGSNGAPIVGPVIEGISIDTWRNVAGHSLRIRLDDRGATEIPAGARFRVTSNLRRVVENLAGFDPLTGEPHLERELGGDGTGTDPA